MTSSHNVRCYYSISSSQVLTMNPFLGIVERINWELYLFSVDKVTVFRKIRPRKLPDSGLKRTRSSQVLKSTRSSQVLTKYAFFEGTKYPLFASDYKEITRSVLTKYLIRPCLQIKVPIRWKKHNCTSITSKEVYIFNIYRGYITIIFQEIVPRHSYWTRSAVDSITKDNKYSISWLSVLIH